MTASVNSRALIHQKRSTNEQEGKLWYLRIVSWIVSFRTTVLRQVFNLRVLRVSCYG
jgi:hypothetical protein